VVSKSDTGFGSSASVTEQQDRSGRDPEQVFRDLVQLVQRWPPEEQAAIHGYLSDQQASGPALRIFKGDTDE